MKRWAGRESEYMREWYLEHRDQESFRRYKRNFARATRRKAGRIQIENQRNMERYRKNPEKVLAHQAVYKALKKGTLIKPKRCQSCHKIPRKRSDGRSGLQAHHPDYKKRLEVTWLCAPCHSKQDKRKL